jgi:hypothetical protein
LAFEHQLNCHSSILHIDGPERIVGPLRNGLRSGLLFLSALIYTDRLTLWSRQLAWLLPVLREEKAARAINDHHQIYTEQLNRWIASEDDYEASVDFCVDLGVCIKERQKLLDAEVKMHFITY